ncbi:MAG: STAS domain-containing protein [Spirochaetales bacterium]|nr:STAS domain-containing protein [Spirochaetales bacterium]
MLRPKLFTCLKGYSKEQFLKDFTAGIIVAIIAFPLSIALAVSSGASPERGLLTAIVGCFIVSLLGGSRVQIAGPTGAFVVIVFRIISEHGLEGLVISTIMAGIILIILGLLKFGDVIKFIPYPITTGFTSGIAITIFVSQIKDLLGLKIEKMPGETISQVTTLAKNLPSINLVAVGIALLTILIIIFWPKVSKKIPGTLVALILTTLIIFFLPGQIETIGSKFAKINLSITLPDFSGVTFSTIVKLIPSAFTIAILAGIESLLSAVVADGMIGGNHRSNMELIATGVANIGSALVGGIPVTGAIARTAANIKNGGRTPVAGLISAIFLLIVSLLLMPLIKLIPMATLAGVLAVVAFNMGEWDFFLQFKKLPKSDYLVFLLTFLLTIAMDLVVGIFAGLMLASLLFMRRVSELSTTQLISHNDHGEKDTLFASDLPQQTGVYEIRGSFFFGAADKFARITRQIHQDFRFLIIKMDEVSVIDATGLNAFERFCREMNHEKIKIVISGISDKNKALLQKHNLARYLDESNFTKDLEEAKNKIQAIQDHETK